ncbi:glutamate receptor ionotropic, NMDA 2B-like [Uloborus diversus]|uniref:glutamate receptor ionotropic, NMDA 2B-like n=1 Tax=Uloborus diversus TaxID=327109 RepID=UPI00240A3E0E|nr:glutamate receptor ionotropic, NMDA 2B-like [Uloborus diversus]
MTHFISFLSLTCSSSFRSRQKIIQTEYENIYGKPEILRIGAILPRMAFFGRSSRAYSKTLDEATKNVNRNKVMSFSFTDTYQLDTQMVTMELSASPLDVLKTLCENILPYNVTAILYMTNAPVYGINIATAQYMLQLTGYLGIPVIAWNVDNIGLEQRVSDSRILQLAPTVEHQAQVMLSILKRYSWHTFSVVTSRIGGHDDFIRAIRDLTQRNIFPDFKFDILDIVTLKSYDMQDVRNELEDIADSEARIFLLFATRMEAAEIMAAATDLGITGKNYVWIASQSVVGLGLEVKPGQFPVGMLGIYINVTMEKLYVEIDRAVNTFAHGIESFYNDPKTGNISLIPNLSCNISGQSRWNRGDLVFKHMRDVSIKHKTLGRPIEFNLDGTLKDVEIYVMNLNYFSWERIGWWENNTLDIKDIVWPGNSPVPPPGVPEKFNLKITFLKEPPYVNLLPPDNETGECKTSRSIRCRIAPEHKLVGINHSVAVRNPEYYKCCSGFCIDLLQKFSQDLKFTYDLYQVEDGAWGVVNANGTWNGLVADLLNHKADIVVTSIKINSDRQQAVDFTVPFLETGIAIVVAKRTGIISPKAFLEPFDTISWLMILLVSIQGAALAIFLFEWLSPYGYDMKVVPPREHKFSLFRTYWLVWAVLFGAAVNVDCPRGYTARFMSSVWAMFAVVFLAIYTANLAAFMITREEYYDLTGIDDKRLQNPHIVEPPFRYGTIPDGNTQAILKKNKPHLYSWMRKYNRSTVLEGIAAVKKGELDAFIYDATVLEYLAGQDNECRLLTVGSWYAMTGYGFALPKKSKYLSMFNRQMIQYRENGDLERLQRFWLQGACKPKAKKRNVSKPLDVNQFMSAFLLLGCGVLFTIFVLLAEHIYFKFIKKHLEKTEKGGYLTLISLSMGKSLNFRGTAMEAMDVFTHPKCKDPVCENTLRQTRLDLIRANEKIKELTARNIMTSVSIISAKQELSLNTTEPLQTRDLTKNYIISNETGPPGYKTHPLHSYGPHFIKTTTTKGDVAEIETVL